MHRSLFVLLVGGTLACTNALALAAEPAGTVVVARAEGDALVLWDASPIVTDVVTNKLPRDEALRNLESQAVGIMSSKAATLKDAQTISVRVIYARTGAVSPVYKAATFTSIEKVVTIKAPTSKISAEAAAWTQQLKAGKIPSDLTVTVTGELPPL